VPIAPSFDELEQIGRAEAIVHRPDLQFNEGDVSEMLVKSAAAMADKCIDFTAQSFKATYLDGAEGADLTLLASDHWGIARFDAVQAIGSVSFTRPTAGAGAGTITAGTTLATIIDADGNEFRFTTDAAVSFGGAELGPKTVNITATEGGRASNAAVGQITRIIDSIFDTTIVVTNPASMAGGTEEETDESLRQRVRSFFGTLRRGTKEALEFGAKQVPGVTVAFASEQSGFVNVYISDSSGNSNAQLIADVTTELENWRCYGIPVFVYGGTPLVQNVDYTITTKTGVDPEVLEPLIEEAIESIFDKLTLGETIYPARLISAILGVDIDNITNVVINTPAVAPVMAGNQLLKAGTITRT
jgi:uncharacterized phage protein gp47/JayE